MECPKKVLEPGTQIRTHKELEETTGMIVHPRHLKARRPDAMGAIGGWVPGHGGDVYWVQHDQEPVVAVYCFTEFELVNA